MWEMLVGLPPFNYADPSDMIYAHLAKDMPDPRLIVPEIPEQVVLIIGKVQLYLTKVAEERS